MAEIEIEGGEEVVEAAAAVVMVEGKVEEEEIIQIETADEIIGTKEGSKVVVVALEEAEVVGISTQVHQAVQSPLLIPSLTVSGDSISPEVGKVKDSWQQQVAEDLGVRNSHGEILSNSHSGATISKDGKVITKHTVKDTINKVIASLLVTVTGNMVILGTKIGARTGRIGIKPKTQLQLVRRTLPSLLHQNEVNTHSRCKHLQLRTYNL